MELHRKLYEDLPSKEDLENNYSSFFRTANDADGLYIILQKVAEKFGDSAYDIGEEVFKEFNMNYDAKAMRTPNSIRRVDYVFDGNNIYDVTIKNYDETMLEKVLKLYNEEVRKIDYSKIIEADEFEEKVLKNSDNTYVAFDGAGRIVAFSSCSISYDIGYVDTIFSPEGDIYNVATGKLANEIITHFIKEGVENITFFDSYNLKDIEEHLSHIFKLTKLIEEQFEMRKAEGD